MAEFNPFDPGGEKDNSLKNTVDRLRLDSDNMLWRIERLEGRTEDYSELESDTVQEYTDFYQDGSWSYIPPQAPLYIIDETNPKATALRSVYRSCKLWVTADDIGRIVQNSTNEVSRWIDRSKEFIRKPGADSVEEAEEPNYFMQDGVNKKPLYDTLGFGHYYNTYAKEYRQYQAIVFDGTDDFMYLKTSLALAYPQTVIMLFNQLSVQAKTTYIGASANTGYYMPGTNSSNLYTSTTSLAIPVTTGQKLYYFEGKGANNSVASINSVDNIGTLNSWTYAINQMYLGGNAANPGTYNSNIAIAEIIIFDKILSAREKDFIREYIYRKYGLIRYY